MVPADSRTPVQFLLSSGILFPRGFLQCAISSGILGNTQSADSWGPRVAISPRGGNPGAPLSPYSLFKSNRRLLHRYAHTRHEIVTRVCRGGDSRLFPIHRRPVRQSPPAFFAARPYKSSSSLSPSLPPALLLAVLLFYSDAANNRFGAA
jgi:hypothetical protein